MKNLDCSLVIFSTRIKLMMPCAWRVFRNNVDDPQDAVVAQMYKNDLEAFNRKAAEWTQNYAREVTMDDKVQHLMEMGFEAA